MGNGKNVALFDIDVADVVSRQLHHVNKLSFAFRRVGPTAYVDEYNERLAATGEHDSESTGRT